VREVLRVLQKLSKRRFEIKLDPKLVRPVDDIKIAASGRNLRALGYTPRHSITETLETTLEYWRKRAE
jgi:nucleoside-diphosphate-sugar epimerase